MMISTFPEIRYLNEGEWHFHKNMSLYQLLIPVLKDLDSNVETSSLGTSSHPTENNCFFKTFSIELLTFFQKKINSLLTLLEKNIFFISLSIIIFNMKLNCYLASLIVFLTVTFIEKAMVFFLKNSSDMEEHCKRVLDKLMMFGLHDRFKEVPGDGNCLFASIAAILGKGSSGSSRGARRMVGRQRSSLLVGGLSIVLIQWCILNVKDPLSNEFQKGE
jgi:hypothetical protein